MSGNDRIKEGEIFIFTEEGHKYNGNVYKIISNAYMKDPSTREWLESIVYRQYKTAKGEVYENPMTFVREKKDFIKKFVKSE